MITQKNKKLLCEYVKYTCEDCKKVFSLVELDIHRIKRGSEGGTYEHRNCSVICKKCHKRRHENEFPHISG